MISFHNSLVSSRSKTPSNLHFVFKKWVCVYIYVYLITVYFQIVLQSCLPEYYLLLSWVLRLMISIKWKEITLYKTSVQINTAVIWNIIDLFLYYWEKSYFTQELANLQPHFMLPEDTTLLVFSKPWETSCLLICSLAKSLKSPQGTSRSRKKSLTLLYRNIAWN